MRYGLGIDPDANGYMVIIDHNLKTAEELRIPLISSASKMVDWKEAANLVETIKISYGQDLVAFLEEPIMIPARYVKNKSGETVMVPGQSAKSAKTQIITFAKMEMLLMLNKISYMYETPRSWQKVMLRGTPISMKVKERGYIKASRIWPNVDFKGPRGGDNFGKSDAYLMALYALISFAILPEQIVEAQGDQSKFL
jgi:hypothetical protein